MRFADGIVVRVRQPERLNPVGANFSETTRVAGQLQ
jgi:hypothetical protein